MTKFKEFCFIELLIIILLSPFLSYGCILNSSNGIATNKTTVSESFVSISQIYAEQLSNTFPEILGGLKRNSITRDQNKSNVIAIYGDHQYEISIIDDLSHNYSMINSFKEQYKALEHANKDNKVIISIRDGYKTITTIHPETGTISMSFVFNERYLFKVTGYQKQASHMVWRFIELNKFKFLHK